MRMDQWIGLNERADKLLSVFLVTCHRVIKDKWDDPNDPQSKVITQEIEFTDFLPDGKVMYQEVSGAWDEVAGVLYEYYWTRNENQWSVVYREKVQAEIWSSGPMYFVALTDPDGNWVEESLWTENEMENS